jgi:hypothetical protein
MSPFSESVVLPSGYDHKKNQYFLYTARISIFRTCFFLFYHSESVNQSGREVLKSSREEVIDAPKLPSLYSSWGIIVGYPTPLGRVAHVRCASGFLLKRRYRIHEVVSILSEEPCPRCARGMATPADDLSRVRS